ncbi:hypothetical protein BJ742DRAFT_786847 [Cladochytrium replicatum]|nr:hypothetical protein BJ742DRAFT_786847 [Cladochytrium replicatum]
MGRKKAVVEASQSRPTTAKSGTSSLGGRIRHNGGIQPQAQSPQALFHTLASEAEGLARREYFVEAIDVFTNALSIPGFEHDKVCLAGRSRCYLLCGNPKLALNDADECMKIDSTFVRGVYQKAESLYDLGEFETALIFYHRGNRLRPDSDDFKMGIQKSTKGIQAAVSKLNVKKWKELQKLINRNTSSMNSATNKNAGATNANRERKLVRTSDRRMDVPALNFDADLEREMLEELYEV